MQIAHTARWALQGFARVDLARVAAVNLARLLTLGLRYDHGWKIA